MDVLATRVQLIDGPFDGEWILDPGESSIWVRRREDGLGYSFDEELDREHYVRTWEERFLWMGEAFRRAA